jgi:hypothetical protein
MMARGGSRLALAVALVLALGAAAGAADEGWLLGRWDLTHDPDGNPKGGFEFSSDGRVVAITPDGHRFGGRYVVSGPDVQLNYKIGEQSIILTLRSGPDRKELFARSAGTGNTSVYEKRP